MKARPSGASALATILLTLTCGLCAEAADAFRPRDERPPASNQRSSQSLRTPLDDPGAAQPGSPAASSDPLTPELTALRGKVRGVLAHYYPRHLNTRDHSPWEVMHGIIAYGVNAQLFRGGPQGQRVNAVTWICINGSCEGEQMLSLNGDKLVARQGPGLQGHYGQLLAILAQSHVKVDYPITVGGKHFTLRDLVEHEKEDCEAGEELTFKLIALMHYLDSDEKWQNRNGQDWSIPRLVQEEIKQPIRGAACGGTHRLMGLSYSVKKRIQRGQPVTGEYARAQKFTNDYHHYTFRLQNSDGSFSTEWFTGRGSNPDVDRRLKTSGHILEWLAFSLSDEDLRDPRMIKAVDYLAGILANDPERRWEIGPLGHGLHALSLYDSRVFRPADAASTSLPVASGGSSPARPKGAAKAAAPTTRR